MTSELNHILELTDTQLYKLSSKMCLLLFEIILEFASQQQSAWAFVSVTDWNMNKHSFPQIEEIRQTQQNIWGTICFQFITA